MTRFSDPILSGFDASVSADASRSTTILRKSYFVSAGAGINVTVSGTMPPNSQNVFGAVYVVQQGAATTNDNITMWTNGNAATGQKVLQWLAIGSAAARLAPTTVITSAAASPSAPATGQTNGGEIPFQIIVSSVSTASYKIVVDYDRGDPNSLGITA